LRGGRKKKKKVMAEDGNKRQESRNLMQEKGPARGGKTTEPKKAEINVN